MRTRTVHASAVGPAADADQLDALVAEALGTLVERLGELGAGWEPGEVKVTLAASEHRTRVVAWCTATPDA